MNGFNCIIIGNDSLPVRCSEIILERGHRIAGVVTAEAGFRQWAEQAGVPVIAPGPDLAERLGGEPFDYLFSIANLSLVPEAVLALPRRAAINYHDGPLPRYAGLHTTSWGILNQERDWAISWHLMNAAADRGDIVRQRAVELLAGDTAFTLNMKCYEAAIEAFGEMIEDIAAERLVTRAQDFSTRVYYSNFKRPEAACVLSWQETAERISALVRALDFGPYLNPLGVAKVRVGDAVLGVGEAEVLAARSTAAPGTVVQLTEDTLTVATPTHDIALRKFITLDNQALGVGEVAAKFGIALGAVLPSLSAEQVTRLNALNAQICRHEGYWRPRLEKLQGPEIPYAKAALKVSQRSRRGELVQALPATVQRMLGEGRDAQQQADALSAAFAAYVSRLTASPGFDLGYSDQHLRGLVGEHARLFAAQVPVNVSIDPASSGASVLAALGAQLESLRAQLTHARDVWPRYPEFHGRPGPVALPVLLAQVERPEDAVEVADSALAFVVRKGLNECVWNYAEEAYDRDSITRMQRQFAAFLSNVLAHPDAALADSRLLNEAEHQQIVFDWNRTQTEFPRDLCVHQCFERQAARTPQAVALAFEQEQLTYQELNGRADQLAHYLRNQCGVGPEDRVGVYLERSLEMLVGLLGVLKAGAAYVPLDPGYPAERVRHMIEDAEVKAVLTQERLLERLGEPGSRVVCLDRDAATIAAESAAAAASGVTPENLCYVIYTSGSTGKPKGVMVRHRNVVNFFTGMDAQVRHEAGAVWLAVTSISFDISVLEIFWTLARGFKVVLYVDKARQQAGSDDSAMPIRSGYASARPIGFSLFYFASDSGEEGDRYRLLLEGAKFADSHGFEAVWTPERHFHAFGGLYPNPSVASAAIAAITKNVQIRAGSCVAPLHNPIRIAEEWAFVDNISQGRVGISFASGWQPNDFVLRPETFADRKAQMFRDIDVIKRLWRGETVSFPGPVGKDVPVRTLPRPIQKELPTWVTIAGNPETFQMAGEGGFHMLTHLLGQSVEELAQKLAIYRQAWREKGHAGEGRVTLMLHTFIGESVEAVRETVRRPMIEYLRTSFELVKMAAWSFPAFKQRAEQTGKSLQQILESRDFTPEEQEALLEFSFERYFETSGLFGTPESCLKMVEKLREIGVDEIACLIDYGVNSERVLQHLPLLNRLRELATAAQAPAGTSLPEVAGQHAVSHLQCTPTMAKMLTLEETGRQTLRRLQTLLVGGEALPAALAAQLRELVPGALINMYGPTETTVWSTCHSITEAGAPVLIGRPLANTGIYILDSALQPVPVGVAGELYIGGEGVTRGYLKRPELTAERFVRHPFSADTKARLYRTGDLARYRADGSIEFLGRIDHQVKIRGFRIELGEIETVLAQHPGVEQAVVVGRADKHGDTVLVAYIVPAAGQSLAATDLRAFLLQRLPEFMLPAMFVTTRALPLTPNGKIDRRALPHPEQAVVEVERKVVAPSSALERRLTELWQEVLGQERIGIQVNFFESGGNSLLAAHLFALIEQRLGKRLPLATLFKAPTVQKLACLLQEEATQTPQQWVSLVPIIPTGSRPPFFCVHAEGGNVLGYYDLARLMGAEQPFYGLQSKWLNGEDVGVLRYEEMAADYLREVRTAQPHGPYYLGGYCLGGDIALEMAQQLTAQGEAVALVVMIQNPRPAYFTNYLPGSTWLSRLPGRAMVRLRYEFERFWDQHRGARLSYVLSRLEEYANQVLIGAEKVLEPVLGRCGVRMPHSKAYLIASLTDNHNRAYADYHPRPYNGRVTVLRVEQQKSGICGDDTLGWGDVLVGEVELDTIPGQPIFSDSNVKGLAEKLRAVLVKVQDQIAARKAGSVSTSAADPKSAKEDAKEVVAVAAASSRGHQRASG